MVAIARQDDVRIQNRHRVIEAVRRSGLASRTDISHKTGLSAATVSAITSDLLDEGVLIPPAAKEIDAALSAGRGRPKVALVINPEAAMVCSVYFHLNFMSAAIVDYAGTTIGEHTLEIKTLNITADEMESALIECIGAALEKTGHSFSRLQRISLAVQGVTDAAGTRVLWTPICPQRDIPIKQWLEDYFSVPTHVANDCDMIAQALNWREPEKYGENFGAVLLAHGVGMGLFLRSSIINGIRSSGVEFGHMTYIPGGALCRCGNRGCIEAYAGDYAINRHAMGDPETTLPSGVLDSPDLSSIAKAARAGDDTALAAITKAGAAIGTGLASLFALVDAFPIVLVGRGSTLFDLMEPSIRTALDSAPSENQYPHIEIDCYPDERPLVREGCAISALLVQDNEMAKRRPRAEAAE